MSETQYGDERQGSIVFGPGGVILPIPENEDLLRRIEETYPLGREALIQLAKFYVGYQTNRPLAKHLAELAVQDPQTEGVFIAEYNDWWEGVEDGPIWPGDGGVDERSEGHAIIQLSVRSVPFQDQGISLLIETVTVIEENDNGMEVKNAHYMIGVSPGPLS